MTIEKRWIFLTLNSLSFLSSEIIFEQASILVGRLCGTAEACVTGADPDCLAFTASQFNGLYVAHFWAGGVTALITGFFIGKYGVPVTALVSSGFLLVGMTFFTVGPYASDDSDNAFAIMLMGRIIYAIGYFSDIVLSQQVNGYWFLGKEMAMAMTVYTVSSRIGSLTAFGSVGSIVEQTGLQTTLWITFGIGLIAPVATMIDGFIYRLYAPESLNYAIMHNDRPGRFDFAKFLFLERDYWFIACIIFLYFSVMFTFLAEFPKFLTEFHGYSESRAGQITGAIPDIAVLAPILAYMIDKVGGRDVLNCIGTGIVFLACLLITSVPTSTTVAVTTAILLAISFAVMTASIWSSIPVVILPVVIGVAIGVAAGIEALASGLMLLITGFILDQTSRSDEQNWTSFFVLVTLFAGLSWILSWFSIYFDSKSVMKPLRRKHVMPDRKCIALESEEFEECERLIARVRHSIF